MQQLIWCFQSNYIAERMRPMVFNSIVAGIIATSIFTLVAMVTPLVGFPKMLPPEVLSMMMGLPLAVGWFMHFMIGIVFALAYTFFLFKLLKKIGNSLMRGIIFGLIAFAFGQLMIAFMGMVFPMPPVQGSMALVMIGSILGHMVFGITVVLLIKVPVREKTNA